MPREAAAGQGRGSGETKVRVSGVVVARKEDGWGSNDDRRWQG